MTIEQAIEIESHFTDAAKSLKCAHRKMKKAGDCFETTCKEIADAALDAENAAYQIRQYIKEST